MADLERFQRGNQHDETGWLDIGVHACQQHSASRKVIFLTPSDLGEAPDYTKVHDRLLRPLLAADRPPAPPELRHALSTIDRHVHTYTDHARLGKAA